MSKCYHCNGYYGPSFGQPVCATCHMFLYPDDSSLHSSSFHCHDLKVEDGDSGNEEPKEPSDCNIPNDASGASGPSTMSPQEEEIGSQEPQNLPSGLSHFLAPQESSVDPAIINRNSSNGSGEHSSNELPQFSLNGNRNTTSNIGNSCSSTGKRSSSCENKSGIRSSSELGNEYSLVTGTRMANQQPFEIPPNWEDLPKVQDTSTPSEGQMANIHSIPPEVLLVVFQMLDEMSLWSVGQVCRRWNQLISSCALQWKTFIQRRWPLFNPIYHVTNWHKVFTNLTESAPCQLCLFRMPYNTTAPAHEDSWRRKRLSNERRTLRSDPPEGINAFPLDKMALHWQATIRGPAGSPYQGGTFFLYIQIPSNYPLSPPLVRFISRIFHPNVSRHGDIGIDSIQHNWSVAITISKVLVSIQSLLTDPYTKVCMEPRIGEMYDENRPQFDRIAKAWTWYYALHDALDPESLLPHYLHTITSGGRLPPRPQFYEEEEDETESKAREEAKVEKTSAVT